MEGTDDVGVIDVVRVDERTRAKKDTKEKSLRLEDKRRRKKSRGKEKGGTVQERCKRDREWVCLKESPRILPECPPIMPCSSDTCLVL